MCHIIIIIIIIIIFCFQGLGFEEFYFSTEWLLLLPVPRSFPSVVRFPQ